MATLLHRNVDALGLDDFAQVGVAQGGIGEGGIGDGRNGGGIGDAE